MFKIFIYRRLFLTFFLNFFVFLLFLNFLFFNKKNKFKNIFNVKFNYNLNYIKIFYLVKKNDFKYFSKFNSYDKFF